MPTRSNPRGHPLFAHVVPGLEEIAESELRDLAPGIAFPGVLRRFDERTSVLLLTLPGSPEPLCQARTIEDLFATVADRRDIPTGWEGLAAIRAAVSEGRAQEAASMALQMRPRRRGRVSFRVICRTAGHQAYRRVDAQRAVEAALKARFPDWRLVDDDATIEAWVHVLDRRLLVGFRLSTHDLRQRAWRVASIPAALKPTVAAAMVRLSEPHPDDLFLDPMCGSGTIPIERALAGRYRLIVCGDADPRAVAATRENVGRRYQPIEIRQWDARELPLDTASANALVCNLPFGKQIGTPAMVRALYPPAVTEWNRVLAPSGRMVLLTSDVRSLRAAIGAHPDLTITRQVSVLVRGQPATIFVTRKRSDD